MTTRPRDTSPEIWRMQREIVAAMSPEARLQAAFEVSEVVRELQIKGLLLRNPTWDRSEAIRRLVLDSTGIDIRRPV